MEKRTIPFSSPADAKELEQFFLAVESMVEVHMRRFLLPFPPTPRWVATDVYGIIPERFWGMSLKDQYQFLSHAVHAVMVRISGIAKQHARETR